MDLGGFAEKLMGMDDASWQRHSNPWSGWSRLTVLPLFALAVWSRVWIGWWCLVPIGLVLLWVWVNPRLFGVPKSTDNWMSTGVLGERIWLNRKQEPIPRHLGVMINVLNQISALGAVAFVYGLWFLDVWWSVAGTVVMFCAKLYCIDFMVKLVAWKNQAVH
ncbi:DUF6653 family protein [Polycladidibacter stylochi]|uniref:DUF6653 family protein n=1 Tax=Polycladidibacter stylochi TaxID=1807766 RepID=UPI00083495B7|nr:DUF6653 family protein [Pseudovibrio stylochi]